MLSDRFDNASTLVLCQISALVPGAKARIRQLGIKTLPFLPFQKLRWAQRWMNGRMANDFAPV